MYLCSLYKYHIITKPRQLSRLLFRCCRCCHCSFSSIFTIVTCCLVLEYCGFVCVYISSGVFFFSFWYVFVAVLLIHILYMPYSPHCKCACVRKMLVINWHRLFLSTSVAFLLFNYCGRCGVYVLSAPY